MKKIIFHIDVNSAFLSWSALNRLKNGDTLDLRTIPSVIGGDLKKRHGVVLAKSSPAKEYGIRTGEPIVNAMRKCPNLTLEPPDHSSYEVYSAQFTAFLASVCPEIEKCSIDECFMDYTPISNRFPSPLAAASYIKEEISKRFGFTVNVGISDRKVLAKMASDFKKPDRIHTLFSDEISQKLWPLPVSALFMCGQSSVETLHNLGIHTIGELAASDCSILISHLKSHGKLLWEYANGIDLSVIESSPSQVKGIGNSITLKEDAANREDACRALRSLAESVSYRLRSSGQLAGMISTEIKYNTFHCVSHQISLVAPGNTNELIYQTACRLFDEIWDGTPIRLLGIRTSKLTDDTEPVQLSLFDFQTQLPNSKRQQDLDKALDQIRDKFGKDAIVRGSLLQHREDYKKH